MSSDGPPGGRPGGVRRGVCLVISAPSGAGKSSTLRGLLAAEPELSLSVSATTRAPRPGEREGIEYFFTDRGGFDAMVERGEMLESATVFGRSYGSPRGPVEAALAAGRDVAFDIDWQGYRQLRAAMPGDVVGVFVLPPSLAALRERLHARGADSGAEIARRMAAARDELSHWAEFDHVVVNTRLEQAIDDVRSVLRSARTVRTRQPGLAGFVASLSA